MEPQDKQKMKEDAHNAGANFGAGVIKLTEVLLARSLVASHAKEELVQTNAQHLPWINGWGLVSLGLVILYVMTGRAEVLPWAALCVASPVIAHMIRQATLVRRNWELYTQSMRPLSAGSNLPMTPTGPSRSGVMIGDILGMAMPIAILLAANYYAPTEQISPGGQLLLSTSNWLFTIGMLAFMFFDAAPARFKN